MAVEHWVAGSGVGLTWTSCFSTEINSLVSGNAVLSATQIDNTTALDIFADVSISLGSVTTAAGSDYLGLYLYPLNEDGTSYGDSQFGSSAAGPPGSSYFVDAIPVPASFTGVLTGLVSGIILPPGKFKFVLFNSIGATLAASGNAVKYRTYNRSVA